ncbi:MAG TPA: SRPBCC family protein [Holophagaceae bacterium]|nr:SRPBCC family protein [Holophagaceae bacterium]
MRTLLKIIIGLLATPLVLALLVALAGIFLPREHRVSRVLHLQAGPERVWALVSDHAQDPTWRPGLAETVRLADRNGHPVWEDRGSKGQRIAYETLESTAPTRLVRRIVDQARFGGTWTYELAPEGTGTRLRITEEGWVGVPFRVLVKVLIGHATTLEIYEMDVARHLGESAKPMAE